MRDLRVVGLGTDGETVIVETVPVRTGERLERFALPVNDQLDAAVRGDLPHLGRAETEQENQMRPREIQARIRAGESVQELASASGVPPERVDRFASPVLQERSRTAELARKAHPVRADGPDVRTLDDVVAETFSRRGHDLPALDWDSWRGESGRWVLQLCWNAGRSDNRAHWTYHPGAHGGTVTAIDDHARALIDPEADTSLRTVRGAEPEPAAAEPTAAEPAEPEAGQSRPASAGGGHDEDGEPGGDDAGPAQQHPEQPPEALAVPDDRVGSSTPDVPADRTTPKRGRKNRPIVPSWEDVLLGTRSTRE